METIHVDLSAPVASVRLNRPDARNAFNETMIAELTSLFADVGRNVRAVVLSGEGLVFCAGADVNWMKRSATYTEVENARDASAMAAMFAAIDECPCPVIGRVHGAALGGGMGFVSCCDIVVAADDAKFGFTEVRLGIVPAVISPFALRKIGPRFARRYFLTGEQFDAVTAARLGLVHEVCPTTDLDARIGDIVSAVLKSGPRAVRIAKALIREVMARSLDRAREHTVATISRTRVSREGQEGLGAFLEKRKPNWL